MWKYLVGFLYFFVAIKCVLASSACQNAEIDISCPLGSTINITNAFYGRNMNTSCSKLKIRELDCSLTNATNIVGNKCNMKTKCSISVNSTDFGNTCSGLTTHLEVNYTCTDSIKCGRNEHPKLGECDCRQYCPSDKRCNPLCILTLTCVCNNGYLRDPYTGRCVLPQYCPLKGDPNRNNEEFCECASRQRTCKNPWAFAYYHFYCEPGYGCKDGYLRDSYTSTCVQPGECPRPYRRWK